MMYLKLMSSQNLPDESAVKNFTLIVIDGDASLEFRCNPNGSTDPNADAPVLAVVTKNGSETEYPLHGNAYVMNAQGKTIANRAPY